MLLSQMHRLAGICTCQRRFSSSETDRHHQKPVIMLGIRSSPRGDWSNVLVSGRDTWWRDQKAGDYLDMKRVKKRERQGKAKEREREKIAVKSVPLFFSPLETASET